ncbi:MAG: hypothetical protein S4CHLAM20_03370 [Chlamydiia bacterium]|nr:hypothetical protein [Chlamydiia bacterium]
MKAFFSTLFLPLAVFSSSFVIDSLDKAKSMARLFEKPIICFFDETLDEAKRRDLAKEYFSHDKLYNSFSHTHLFTHTDHGQKGESGFMIISSKGEIISTITTYGDFKVLSSDISKTRSE